MPATIVRKLLTNSEATRGPCNEKAAPRATVKRNITKPNAEIRPIRRKRFSIAANASKLVE
jgi:hypothetical protein